MSHPQDLELEATQHSLETELRSPVIATESWRCPCPLIFTSEIHEFLYIESGQIPTQKDAAFLKRKG